MNAASSELFIEWPEKGPLPSSAGLRRLRKAAEGDERAAGDTCGAALPLQVIAWTCSGSALLPAQARKPGPTIPLAHRYLAGRASAGLVPLTEHHSRRLSAGSSIDLTLLRNLLIRAARRALGSIDATLGRDQGWSTGADETGGPIFYSLGRTTGPAEEGTTNFRRTDQPAPFKQF